MSKDGLKYWLELTVNVALLAVVALIGVTYVNSRSAVQPVAAAQQARPQIKAGDTVQKFASYSTQDKTLVAVMSTTCHFCRESLTALADLDKTAKANGKSQVAVVLQPSANPIAAAQFLSPAAEVRYIAGLSSADFAIHGTPTFALVDRKGKVSKVWVGRLDAQSTAEIKAYL